MLYRTVCKETFRKVELDILLDAKQAIDAGRKAIVHFAVATPKDAGCVWKRLSIPEFYALFAYRSIETTHLTCTTNRQPAGAGGQRNLRRVAAAVDAHVPYGDHQGAEPAQRAHGGGGAAHRPGARP